MAVIKIEMELEIWQNDASMSWVECGKQLNKLRKKIADHQSKLLGERNDGYKIKAISKMKIR